MGKRLFDILGSLAGLVITLPLYPFIAAAIRLDSPGPIFYCQSRVGLNGKPFTILKFRTMEHGADSQRHLTTKVDSRITGAGQWLRRTKLDEIPTFMNVLKGEMSLVGPRPERQVYVSHYTPEQLQVLSVRPGITDLGTLRFVGEADLLGDEANFENIYIRNILPEKLRLNLEYIANRSFWYDIRILLSTLLGLVRNKE